MNTQKRYDYVLVNERGTHVVHGTVWAEDMAGAKVKVGHSARERDTHAAWQVLSIKHVWKHLTR